MTQHNTSVTVIEQFIMAIAGILFVLGMLFMPTLIAVALVMWAVAVIYDLATPVPSTDTGREIPA